MASLPLKMWWVRGIFNHLYVINIKPSEVYDRNVIQNKLNKIGIETGIHYPIPCHLQPAYGYLGYQEGDFPNAESLCDNILSLPMYPGIKDEQLQMVSDKIKEIIISG